MSWPISASPPPVARKRRARGSISVEEIVQGAFELAESESLEALSMPRLAARLDVGVTSIYWYFRSKDDLLDVLTEQAMGMFQSQLRVPAGLSWEEHLRTYFREFRRIFQQNKIFNDLIIMRTGNFTEKAVGAAWEQMEGVLAAMVGAGFSRDDAIYGYAALSVYTRGALFIERGHQVAATRTGRRPTPGATEVAFSGHATAPTVTMTELHFEGGLDNAIRGLRALLEG